MDYIPGEKETDSIPLVAYKQDEYRHIEQAYVQTYKKKGSLVREPGKQNIKSKEL
jgi:hypothetical protein